MLSKDLSNFFLNCKDLTNNDQLVSKILSSFKVIKKIHEEISKDLETQREKICDEWDKIDFYNSFAKLYPTSLTDYIFYSNNHEYLCKFFWN